LKIKAVNGFKDLMPEEVFHWLKVESLARDIFNRFCFNEIRLPILEKTELFARSIGESTDIVEKEMYTFDDKGITMRPEATASLLRSFIENGLHIRQPIHRLFTIGPMFRHERPQKGRLRQFHQIDAEIIGAHEPLIDAELIAMGQLLLSELDLRVSLEINSLGCPVCRPGFQKKLVDYLEDHQKGFCDDCTRRTNSNPLRVLDCKKETCKKLVANSPSILDFLCNDCMTHFDHVCKNLDRLNVEYKINRFMVRGLDYYTRTTFEFLTDDLGAQAAVGAGGRYDGLIEQLGGPKLPGIGFALGMERLVLLLQTKNSKWSCEQPITNLFLAALGKDAENFCSVLVYTLRKAGIRSLVDYSGRSLKAQMKLASKNNSRYVLIIGDEELKNQNAILRNMISQEQTTVSLKGTPLELSMRLIDHLNDNQDRFDLFQSIQI